jgi:acyl-CoA thioesterase-1
VLLCIGGNDFLRRIPRRQAEANVRAMVKLARERGIDVLLIGTPEPGLRIATPAFYAAIAEDFGLAYEAADPIHPNAAGYRVIAERVAERLRKSGAI